jgi:release factor glutamine methyltransferase
MGLGFAVGPAVLIPRPETELLVAFALEKATSGARVLDLGTGSGAIAVSLAHLRRDLQVTAVDSSGSALEIARRNADRLGAAHLELMPSDWFEALGSRQFDVIVSNPPYIAADDEHLARGDLRFEPREALTDGGDGLRHLDHLVSTARGHLAGSAWLALEHGHDQAAQVRSLLQRAGFGEVASRRDLAGIERISFGRQASS